MIFKLITKEIFTASAKENLLLYPKEDAFAKTFIAKANTQNMWDRCIGLYVNGYLVGAMIVTVSKRQPITANLQLLHVFNQYRGLKYGKLFLQHALSICKDANARYFRVSSERSAQKFYESTGIKFYGEQKSGTLLSICELMSYESFKDCLFDDNDPYIRQLLYSGRKGALASSWTTTEN